MRDRRRRAIRRPLLDNDIEILVRPGLLAQQGIDAPAAVEPDLVAQRPQSPAERDDRGKSHLGPTFQAIDQPRSPSERTV